MSKKFSSTLKGQCPDADFLWLLPLFVKIDRATFEVNMTNYSQGITSTAM